MTVRYIAFRGAIPETPIDVISGAFSGYSVARKLRAAYGGSAIRVRRVSDDAEVDIGFDGSNNMDVAALASHCGASNGFISKVYNQGSSGSDLLQATTTLQPKIYDGSSVLIGELGKPAASLSGIQYLHATGYSVFASPLLSLDVLEQVTWISLRSLRNSAAYSLLQSPTTSKLNLANHGTGSIQGGDFGLNVGFLLTVRLETGVPMGMRRNNDSELTGPNTTFVASDDLYLTSDSNFYELIFLNNNVSADITTIQTNINAYYSIW